MQQDDIEITEIQFSNANTLDKTNGLKWRVYSFFWTRLFPVRRYLLGFYRRIWLKIFGTK